jgi:quinol monooxygenase YgiN
MPAFNVVKFKIKPGQESAFLDAHRGGKAAWPGLVRADVVKTGELSYCLIGQWPDKATLAAARPAMIATLDTFRSTLDEVAEGRGVTDAVSGEAVLSI